MKPKMKKVMPKKKKPKIKKQGQVQVIVVDTNPKTVWIARFCNSFEAKIL